MIAALLYVLLYLPVCSFDEKGLISISQLISKKVQLPFIVNFVPNISRHFDKSFGQSDEALLGHPAAQRTLRLAWNSGKYSGTTSDFAEELKMTDFDHVFWKKLCLAERAEEISTGLKKAKNHRSFRNQISAAKILCQILPVWDFQFVSYKL